MEVDNNVWLLGDTNKVVVIDTARDDARIAAAIGARRVVAVVGTHAHNDHINAALALADRTGAPTPLHLNDRILWHQTHQ